MIKPMNLSSPKGAAALEIVRKLKDKGYDALFAGGCVRDHLLGTLPTDYDIATSAVPDQVESLFSKTIPVGKQFGVILVIVDGMQFEVATFRTEGGYQDGRRPGFVNFSNAKEDALRRDFTVNGMFYDPIKQEPLDYVGGQEDLEKKVIRCIGEPAKRFDEDKLRLLRAIRFAARLDFDIEATTWNEIKKRAEEVNTVSKERIRDELDKIMTGSNVQKGLGLLRDSRLWQSLWPQIELQVVIERFNKLSDFQLLDVRLAAAIFFYGIPRNEVLGNMRVLRYSNDVMQDTLRILDLEKQIQELSRLREGKIRQILNEPLYLKALHLHSTLVSHSQSLQSFEFFQEKSGDRNLPGPFLNGDDLKSQGLEPGPKMKDILQEGYLLQLEGKFKDRAEALIWAQSYLKRPQI